MIFDNGVVFKLPEDKGWLLNIKKECRIGGIYESLRLQDLFDKKLLKGLL